MDIKPAYLRGRGRGFPTSRDDGRTVGQANTDNLKFTKGSKEPTHGMNQGGDHGRGMNHGSNFGRGMNQGGDFGRGMNRGGAHNQMEVPKSGQNKGYSSALQSQNLGLVTFQNAVASHQEVARRHLAQADDLSSSEDDDDEGANNDGIMDSLLLTFRNSSDNRCESKLNLEDLGRAQDHILNALKSKASVCLVCIETIKKNEAIWNCIGCFTMFHIPCIQKWVKDGVYQATSLSEEHFPNRDLPWFCPKCRQEYKQLDAPKRYVCFCGKQEDPAFDPWLVPHSCGQVCKKALRPNCGHSCLLLCHPGPCPPCPQTVKVRCHCQRQKEQTRRCGTAEWSCGQPCRKPLACGQHSCSVPCHSGSCPTCPEFSEQRCLCGRHVSTRSCSDPTWQCEEVCGKQLSCEHHSCEKVCHSGDCGLCPRAGNRTCPCGKSKFEIPCTEEAPTCLETCAKTLDCGSHPCTQRCHAGPCGTCREMVRKKCQCGKREKEVQCFKDYQCDTKCNNMKDCGRHPCKRKCCDGNCPPCTLTCGKTLGCHQHKCCSTCHRGPCYPCPLTVAISCNCGKTKINVPCGAEKRTRPPKCNQRCNIPPDCHHPARAPHHCHFGYCPPCKQICMKALTGCDHTCPALCHGAIRVKVKDNQPKIGPWEVKSAERMEVVSQLCPPCIVPVPITCYGQHETSMVRCCDARISSCHRQCARLLACTNHTCQLSCHRVEGAPDLHLAGTNCEKCEEACSRPRPDGCSHPCLEPCHPGHCPPCVQMIRMRCHCQLVVRHIECDQWTHADDCERERLQSCQCKCPKTLPCGHQCKAICHPGLCPNPKRCVEKVKLRCQCRRKKGDFVCNEVQSGLAKIDCDEVCFSNKEKLKQQKEAEDRAKAEEAVRQQQEELEEFERKMRGGRKRKPRRQQTHEENPSLLHRYGMFVVGPALIILLAFFIYYLFNK